MTNAIKDEIERCANVANTKFMATNYPLLSNEVKGCMTGVNFLWGHPLEIANTLLEYTKHKDKKFEKFPLIALYTDINVQVGKYGDYDGVNLTIIIANATNQKLTSAQREVRNFIPILRPIYGYFIDELERSSVFSIQDPKQDMKHNMIERFFWGKEGIYNNTGNVFNDYIDAIEISNLDLKINLNNC